MKKIRATNLVAVLAALCLAGTAVAQTPPPAGQVEELPLPGSDLRFSLSAGYQFIFETDVKPIGTVDIDRTGLELKGRTTIARDFRLEMNFRFMFSNYDFNNAVVLDPINGDPWDDIQTILLDGRIEWWMTNDIAMIFGPFLMFSRESSAEWNDAFTGGGFVGFMFISSRNLVWGGGLGISTQICDSLLVYPIIILDWKINDQLKLSSVAGPVGLAYTGLELIWDVGHGFEAGFGFRYEYRRFRLGPTGFAPNGAGEDTSWPLWARISYSFNEHVEIDLYGGLVAGGRFKVDDFNGRPLTREDYDITPTLALGVRVNF